MANQTPTTSAMQVAVIKPPMASVCTSTYDDKFEWLSGGAFLDGFSYADDDYHWMEHLESHDRNCYPSNVRRVVCRCGVSSPTGFDAFKQSVEISQLVDDILAKCAASTFDVLMRLQEFHHGVQKLLDERPLLTRGIVYELSRRMLHAERRHENAVEAYEWFCQKEKVWEYQDKIKDDKIVELTNELAWLKEQVEEASHVVRKRSAKKEE